MTRMLYIAAISLVFAGSIVFSQDPQKPKAGAIKEKAEFTGKILVVYCKAPATGGNLSDAAVKQLAGRSFLVGDAVNLSEASDPPKGTRTWIAVDDITTIIEYSTLDAAKESHGPKLKD